MCIVDIMEVFLNMQSKAFQDKLNEKINKSNVCYPSLVFSKTGKYAWFNETNPKGKVISTNYYENIWPTMGHVVASRRGGKIRKNNIQKIFSLSIKSLF